MQTLSKDMQDMDGRLEFFKKESDQISKLNEKFQSLDGLMAKVNSNITSFYEKEADLDKYGEVVEKISTNYDKLEKSADSSSHKLGSMEDRSSRLDRTLKEMENRTAKLGAEDKRLHGIIERMNDIDGIVSYLDAARKELSGMKDWVLPRTDDLKKYLHDLDLHKKDLDDLLRQVKSIFSRQSGLESILKSASDDPPSSPAEDDDYLDADKGKQIMQLYKQEKWSYDEIARNMKISVDAVKKYIRRNL